MISCADILIEDASNTISTSGNLGFFSIFYKFFKDFLTILFVIETNNILQILGL